MSNTDFSASPADADDTENERDASSAAAPPVDGIDPVVEGLLAQMWEADHDPSGKVWSLAKLAKRAQLPQSTLRRYLTSLTEAGLATVTLDEAGLGSSTLTDFGRSVCADLFDADASGSV